MGVKGLSKFVQKYGTSIFLEDLYDKTIIIDTHIYLYKFKYSKKNIISCFKNQILKFKKSCITPIYVFDGVKSCLKDIVIKKRKEKNSLYISKKEIDELKDFFKENNIKYITGISEGEKTCSSLNRNNDNIYAVLSNDYDCLPFNCKRLIVYNSGYYTLYDTDEIIKDLNINMSDFIDICIISGTDYSNGIKGLGIVKAYKKLKKLELKDILLELENYNEIKGIFENFEKELDIIIDNFS
jgi:flap endonuclease-1